MTDGMDASVDPMQPPRLRAPRYSASSEAEPAAPADSTPPSDSAER